LQYYLAIIPFGGEFCEYVQMSISLSSPVYVLSFAWNLASWASVYMRKKCIAHALISSPPPT
jgi:hypothetical protein